MRVQDGSEGCRTAQVRDVSKGCAGEVMGAIFWRVGGRVVVFGKRIGETNFLGWVLVDGYLGLDFDREDGTYGYLRRAISASESTCA